jgi:hypothetical protein
VTDVTGQVRRGDRALRLLEQLAEGDRLVLASGATLSATWYSDGRRETVQGPAEVTVTAAGLSGAPVTRSPRTSALGGLRAPVSSSPGAQLAVTGRGVTPALLAAQPACRVSAAGLSFWIDPPREAALPLKLEILDARGRPAFPPQKLAPLQFPLEWRCPRALAAGQSYLLKVSDARGVPVAVRLFTVLDAAGEQALAAELERLRASPARVADYVELALLAQDLGLTEVALQAVGQALQERPDPRLLEWAAELAGRAGQPALGQLYRLLAPRLETP